MGKMTGLLVDTPPMPGYEERGHWIAGLEGVATAGDGLIRFRDNVDRAARTGVAHIW